MIEVENLTKKYGHLVAVKNLNFKVEKGKIWGLLGPNAAGKTTSGHFSAQMLLEKQQP